MFGLEGTECKIEDCDNPVWPNKTLGYCNRHYQRFKTGRMLDNGDLAPYIKEYVCERCGKKIAITLIKKPHILNHVKYCPECRSLEYKQTCKDNYNGIFRRPRTNSKKIKERYVEYVLNRFINVCDRASKYHKMVDMKKKGKTYREIGEIFGLSKQAIQQKLRSIGYVHISPGE